MTDCFNNSTLLGCFGGQPVAVHYTYDNSGSPAVRITNLGGVVVAGANLGNTILGACPVSTNSFSLSSGAAQIAGPDRAATAEFTGASDSWDSPSIGNPLVSISVIAKSVIDGMPFNTADQVTIQFPNGTILAMMDGEARSFSVARDQDFELINSYTFTATGNAYANITYSFV